MKKLLATLLLITTIGLIFPNITEAAVRVKGYIKPRSGKYVMPYYKTSPNKTKFDNWSTKGNTNPFTGKKGTVNPFKIKTLKFK
jgi:hypothetical protein